MASQIKFPNQPTMSTFLQHRLIDSTDKIFKVLLLLVLMIFQAAKSSTISDSLGANQSLKDGDTLVSSSGGFEFGFFSLGNSSNRYLGVWYRNVVSHFTAAWVANREAPLLNRHGVLNLTHQGSLVLFNDQGQAVWSSKALEISTPILQLLDTGNVVIRDLDKLPNPDQDFSWQSFHYPTDTLLSKMKLGKSFVTGLNWHLTSWRSEDDLGLGDFSAWIDPSGFPQLMIRKGNATYYRGGPWTGLYFSGTPQTTGVSNIFDFQFSFNLSTEVYYLFVPRSTTLISRLVLMPNGILKRFGKLQESTGWTALYRFPNSNDQCDYYAVCGVYASCSSINSTLSCNCLDGFEPRSPKEWKASRWSGGCSRKVELNCSNAAEFIQFTGKLPDTFGSWFNTSMKSLAECRAMCARNCSCTAYANSDIRNGGSGCLHWFDDLIDMRTFTDGGQDLYVRIQSPKGHKSGVAFGKKKKIPTIIGSSLLFIFLVALVYYFSKKLATQEEDDEFELPVFDFNIISKATDNFSDGNMLGKGGFGSVYKGTLPDKQEIAVKRLSETSGQGADEFRNEMKVIAKLQHRNLVKLIGCCIHGAEKLLVYEFLPNRSLDNFIFDEKASSLLDWPRRMHIIEGIARGLLYLHQDSRLRIIHRDLKASNVLLDDDMNPKISDFGMARIFGGDQTEANTNRVVGTFGYMPPEYAVHGHFSMKSDVFGFGVMVIELISGKKNRGFCDPDHGHNLLGYAWNLWMQQRPMEVVAAQLRDPSFEREIRRSIHVGLLCVQQQVDDRPNMSAVVLMLGSDSPLPEPRNPGFYFTDPNLPDPLETNSSKYQSGSANQMSFSVFEAR